MTEHTSIPDASRFESLAPAPVDEPSPVAARIGSAVALLGLLVGLPIALVLLGGAPPIPTELPAVRDLARHLGPEDLVTVLVAIVWILWAIFVVCVVLEVVAARRGGMARTVPFAGPLQHLARTLIGGLLVTGLVAGTSGAASAAVADVAGQSGSVSTVVTGVADDAVEEAAEQTRSRAEQVQDRLEGELVYTVKAPHDGYHDNLWDIAERHLGDGFRYKEIYELNKDRVQLDGRKLELARLIHPGWQLIMPPDAVGVERVPLNEQPATAPPAGGGSSQAGGSVGDDAATATGSAIEASESRAWRMGAGLLATGLLGALAVARRRRPGTAPEESARAIAAALRLAADPDRARGLEAVLCRLTVACRDAGVDLPSVYAAVVGPDEVILHLAPAQPQAVPGWQALDDGAQWRYVADLATLERPAGVEPALPSLVSLGVDDQGRDVLVDLASSGGLVTIGGDLHVSAEVVTSLALQAAVSPWTCDVQVLASGLPEEITEIADRICVVRDAESAAAELEDGRDDVFTGRLDDGEVTVLAIGTPTASYTLERVAAAATTRSRTAVVAVGDHDAARWRLHVDEHGNLHVPQLGLAVVANRIAAHQAEAVASLFVAADLDPADGSDEARVPIDPPRTGADDAAWLTATSRVGVLGPVIADGAGEPDERRAAVLTEILAYLAMHPEGVHPTVLAGAVWPLGVTGEVRDANIERARQWLGSDREGGHRLRESLDGRLSLAPDVVCDWDAFRVLVAASRRTSSRREEIDLLRRALKLVRGPAFDRAPRGRYAWAAEMGAPRRIGELVIDAALRLASLLQDDGDPSGASAAAGAILRMYPTHAEAWQIVLRARHASGGPGAVDAAVAELETALDDEPMDPTTAALVEELLPHRASQIS